MQKHLLQFNTTDEKKVCTHGGDLFSHFPLRKLCCLGNEAYYAKGNECSDGYDSCIVWLSSQAKVVTLSASLFESILARKNGPGK